MLLVPYIPGRHYVLLGENEAEWGFLNNGPLGTCFGTDDETEFLNIIEKIKEKFPLEVVEV